METKQVPDTLYSIGVAILSQWFHCKVLKQPTYPEMIRTIDPGPLKLRNHMDLNSKIIVVNSNFR